MWLLAIAAALADPPPLADGSCACWTGELHGNDDVQASLRLCRSGDELDGGLDWTGSRSGRSSRRVEGTLVGGAVTLHDTAIPLSRPSAGWRFCRVDQYSLSLAADGVLHGTYDSAACHDHATLSLRPSACPAAEPASDTTVRVRGPAPALVPEEVQACRDRGALWLSDPDSYERTEIETAEGWTPVWQVLDRQGGRAGYLLVYPGSCRVVVGIETPQERAEPTFELVPPPGSSVTPAEETMLRRWARRF